MFPIFFVLLLLKCIFQINGCGDTMFTWDNSNDVGPTKSHFNSYCYYKIRPSRKSNGYMTVLEWHSFDIQDNMPTCYQEAVTIFIG